MRISDWSSDVCSSDLAPPDFAEPRIGGERAAIGGDAVVLPPDRLQHMAIAHPPLRMIGEAARQLLVERKRLVIAADAAERGGARTEGRRVGKECGCTGSSGWWRET